MILRKNIKSFISNVVVCGGVTIGEGCVIVADGGDDGGRNPPQT